MKNLMDISAMLKLKEKGMSNRAIAKTLGVDKKTVNKYWNQYKSNFEKLETTNNSTKIIEIQEEKQNYDYEFIQTRTHNKIVVHMFDTLHFDVIGQNYHKIEKQPNWVAVYDLKKKRNFDEMYALAAQLYSGFSENWYATRQGVKWYLAFF